MQRGIGIIHLNTESSLFQKQLVSQGTVFNFEILCIWQ